jgi:predicted PurR-regulated permease PerM
MEKWTRLLVFLTTWLSIILLVGILIRLTFYIEHTVLLFSVGALLAYALDPIVELLRKTPLIKWRGNYISLPRPVSVGIVFLILTAILALAITSLTRPALHQLRLLGDPQVQKFYRKEAMDLLISGDARLSKMGVHHKMQDYLNNPSSLPPSIQTAESEMGKSTVLFIGGLAISVGEGLIVLLITIYLLIYSGEMRTKFNAMLPPSLLPHAEVWEEDVNRILGGFVRGQLTISILLGIAAAIACAAVGIRFWLLIGIFVLGASLIPVFGPYIGAAPAVILALLTPTHFASRIVAAIVVLLVFITINEGASKVLYPRLVGRAIGLHEVLVLFVLFAGLELGGVAGVLFAAPVTAIAIATIVHLFRFWQNLPDSLLFNTRRIIGQEPGQPPQVDPLAP